MVKASGNILTYMTVRLFTLFDQLGDKYSVSITVCGSWSAMSLVCDFSENDKI